MLPFIYQIFFVVLGTKLKALGMLGNTLQLNQISSPL